MLMDDLPVEIRERGLAPRRPARRPLKRPVVHAPLTFQAAGQKNPAVLIPPEGTGGVVRTAHCEPREVAIRNGWSISDLLSLDRQGFTVAQLDVPSIDFDNETEVKERYYPEIENLVAEATGASEVLVFDHNVRRDSGPDVEAGSVRKGVRVVHNDYTADSAPRRVRDLLPEDAEERLGRRVAFINVWRPIKGPVERSPLALADARSVDLEQLSLTELRYDDRQGWIYEGVFDARHQWFYFPEMRSSDALLIKCYDSRKDGTARFTLHTAFDDPETPADAAPRESIEARTIAFFDEKN